MTTDTAQRAPQNLGAAAAELVSKGSWDILVT